MIYAKSTQNRWKVTVDQYPIPPETTFRIGAISKLTLIPVSTLRIWEARYQAFTPIKSSGNQRLYLESDVTKALLLKTLLEAGHSIGSVAHLSCEALRQLSLRTKPQVDVNSKLVASAQNFFEVKPVSVAVVGLGLAARIESKKMTLSFRRTAITISHVFNDLTSGLIEPLQAGTQILLVRANSLRPSTRLEIDALSKALGSLKTIVIFNFAPQTVVDAMKLSGILMRRDPISDSDLADLISSVLLVDSNASMHDMASDLPESSALNTAMIPARKYSNETLDRVAGISTDVLCECPRHVAELLTQLGNFEEYSQECLNSSDKDAHLHATLAAISGSARALFERALEMVASHEGIKL
jgi:MerR family transcriptional regulator, light-induced transcriptional regulator